MAVTGKQDIYFSVDIEADGPYPGRYSMSSFGIVPCGRHDGNKFHRLDYHAGFYRELVPISDDFVPEAAAVSGLDRKYLWIDGHKPENAMQEAAAYVKNTAGDNRAVFCAYPLGFDWLFFYWYLMSFNVESPFGHSNHVDIKTLYMTKAKTNIGGSIKRKMPDALKSKHPHTHNALDDAEEQGELFANIMEWSGN